MPEVDRRVGAKPVEEILADFDRQHRHFEDLAKTTQQLIQTILSQENLPFQSVQARVKSPDKLRIKYCKSNKDYKSLTDLSDLVGFRIITYYSDKIDEIANLLETEFSQLGEREDKRIEQENEFGYSAIHLDCAYSKTRIRNSEYRRFEGARFEIQITTILGHAWAEMYHPWYDAKESPRDEVRRFQRLAAVLELAEQEFLEVRKKKDDRERVAAVRVAANVPEIPISPETLKAFIDDEVLVDQLDQQLAEIMDLKRQASSTPELLIKLATLFKREGIETIEQLRVKLREMGNVLPRYVEGCKPLWGDISSLLSSAAYTKGFCLLHLASFLIFLKGKEEVFQIKNESGFLVAYSGWDIDSIVELARSLMASMGNN